MTTLRRASTVCVVREGNGVEVLMVRRPLTARFMPGVWVFPGGAVDSQDEDAPPSFGGNHAGSEWKVAALRELIEETGLWLTSTGPRSVPLTEDVFSVVEDSGFVLDPDSLIYFSNWITPAVFPIRFDTRFFLAVVDPDSEARVDGDELIDLAWVTPPVALEREASGEWEIAFPTRKTLELLASEPTVGALSGKLTAIDVVPPVEPRLYVGDDEAQILMPDEAGFDEAGPAQSDPTILQRLSAVVAGGGQVPAEFKSRS
jgi:8-oxo-dGTP pyrophosphatase MutT (NUDIX family)